MGEASYGFLGEGQDDWSGMAVSPAGDMDRDGLPDLTIGAMGHSTQTRSRGRGYLFYAQNTAPGVTSFAMPTTSSRASTRGMVPAIGPWAPETSTATDYLTLMSAWRGTSRPTQKVYLNP